MPKKGRKNVSDAMTSAANAQLDFITQMGKAEAAVPISYEKSRDVFVKKHKGKQLTKNEQKQLDSIRTLAAGTLTADNLGALQDSQYAAARAQGNKARMSALFKKNHNRIGRFGQKTISKEDEKGTLFEKLDQQGKIPYFDPFESLAVTKAGEKAKNGNESAGEEVGESAESSVEIEQMRQALLERSTKNIQLISESDFEAEDLSRQGKLAAYLEWYGDKMKGKDLKELGTSPEFETPQIKNIIEWKEEENAEEGVQERTQSQKEVNQGMAFAEGFKESVASISKDFAAQYDSAKGFEPDYKTDNKDSVPNEFETVVVVNPPTDVYVDYQKQVTDETHFVLKQIYSSAQPDYIRILDDNVKKSAAYAEIVAKGQAAAQSENETYDPALDPNVILLRSQIARGIAQEQGHSFVRMVAKDNGKTHSSYSFGFWPLGTTPGVGGVTVGVVKNPDPETFYTQNIERRFSVSFPNYLRAAAKIRGVVGSQRSYSFTGYNCTSFAADVANEAGISVKAEDSAEKMRTFKYKSAMIESPYSLAKFVRQANKRTDLSEDVYKREAAESDATGLEGIVKEKIEDWSFLETVDNDTFKGMKALVEKELRAIKENQTEGRNKVRRGFKNRVLRSYIDTALANDVRTGFTNALMNNPLFMVIQQEMGNGEPEKFAYQFLLSIMQYSDLKLQEVKKHVEDDVDVGDDGQVANDFDKKYDLAGMDNLTMQRKLTIARKREWMQKTFGYGTVSEYLSAVVKKPEVLATTLMKMKRDTAAATSGIDIGSDMITQILLNGMNTNAAEQAKLEKNELLQMLKSNDYFKNYVQNMQGGAYLGRDLAEEVLDAILLMSRENAPDMPLDLESQEYKKFSNVERSMIFIQQQKVVKQKLGTNSVKEFVVKTCQDSKALERAVKNGLKMPVNPEAINVQQERSQLQKQFTVERVRRALGEENQMVLSQELLADKDQSADHRQAPKVLGEENDREITERMREKMEERAKGSFNNNILEPLYHSLPTGERPGKFYMFAKLFRDKITFDKMLDVAAALANKFLPARNLLLQFNRLDPNNALFAEKQEEFLEAFFEKAVPLSEEQKQILEDEDEDDEETVILKEKMLEKNENGIQDVMEYLKKVLIESGIALVSYFSFDSDVQPDNN